jgi:DNA-binding NtrC family response regulator
MEDVERSVILQALKENEFNRTATAKKLGISRRALIYKLKRYQEQGYSINPE